MDLMQALKRRSLHEPKAENAAEVERHADRALERYRGGDKAAAEALCRDALALDQRETQAWSLRARIALDDKQPQRALECYARILAIHPDEPEYPVDPGEVNSRAGHPVARSWEGYVEIALGLAADLPALAQLRARLRERLRTSPLLDAEGFTHDLETLYRAAWRKWCVRSMPRSQPC